MSSAKKNQQQQRQKGASAEPAPAVASTYAEKLQLLRSVTKSKAETETAIITDAYKYINQLKSLEEELKQKLALHRNVPAEQNPTPIVTVETVGEGFLVKVFSEKKCEWQFASVLEAFASLRLRERQVRVCSTDSFQVEALVKNEREGLDVEVVKQVVFHAVSNCVENMVEE